MATEPHVKDYIRRGRWPWSKTRVDTEAWLRDLNEWAKREAEKEIRTLIEDKQREA